VICLKTIDINTTSELIIKNSRFITQLIKINDTDIDKILEQAKIMYPKATHYCYCYRLRDTQKSSDDGEPGGTAGIPMLNVFIKEDIVNVLAITIRYFGGIKLGAGGLVRAYTKSLTTALQSVNMIDLCEGYLIKISINYDEQKQLDYILKDMNVISKDYSDNVIYLVEVNKDNINLIDNYNYEILENRMIEK
jgi:uncharacterized YigZ family protein